MGGKLRLKLNAPRPKSTPPAREMGAVSHRDGIVIAPRRHREGGVMGARRHRDGGDMASRWQRVISNEVIADCIIYRRLLQ